MNEKIELPFKLKIGRLEDRNQRVLIKELNPEWTIICFWSHTVPFKLDFIDISRNSTLAECLLQGKLSVLETGNNDPLVQRKFITLLEPNCRLIRLELGYTFNSTMRSTFYLKGRVIISAFENFSNYEGSDFEHLLRLSNDLKTLLNPEVPSYADVKLRCGAVTIPAHKCILSARSPVFAAMFANNMKESRENNVDIIDIEDSVLRCMLNFIYSGRISDVSVSKAPDLLHAADMYQLDGLKTSCITYMKSTVSRDNVINILVLGELYDADLKHFAMKFICDKCDYFSVLKNTQEWKALQSEMPSLALEVLSFLVGSKEEKLATKNS